MSSNPTSRYVYVTFIRTTQEKLWTALTDPDFTQRYWFGARQDSDWKVGSPWKMVFPDGRVTDSGEVIEVDPPRRLALSWRNEFMPELNAEGFGRCLMELEPLDGAVKLTVTHEMDKPDAKLIKAVSGGWPQILSNLKSLLETGELAIASKPAKSN
jgi:uncharacterized protein YndB with AHSA1/START domain